MVRGNDALDGVPRVWGGRNRWLIPFILVESIDEASKKHFINVAFGVLGVDDIPVHALVTKAQSVRDGSWERLTACRKMSYVNRPDP